MARGDRLVTRRFTGCGLRYLHHGIDMGDGSVVHARPDDPRRVFSGGRVERTSLVEFADGRTVSVVCDPPAEFTPDEVARRAASHVGREGYSPVVDNCEHFATWCATGRRESRQIDLVADRIGRTATRVITAAAARATAGEAGRLGVRTIVGTTVRVGLRSLVSGAVVSEGIALASEFGAHTAGCDAAAARAAGERAGWLASVGFHAAAGVAAGPLGVLAGACVGAALWTAGKVASRALDSGSRAAA